MIRALALGVGRGRADGRDAVSLRPGNGVLAVWAALKCRLTNKSALKLLASAGRIGKSTNVSLLRVRMTLKPARFNCSRNSMRQQEGVGLFIVGEKSAHAVAGVLAAVAGVEADGGDAFRFKVTRRVEQGTDGVVEVELRDEDVAVVGCDGKGERDVDAVDLRDV